MFRKLAYALFVVLAVLALAIFSREFVSGLSSVNPSIGTALVAASATVLVSVLTLVGGKYLESQAHIRKELRDRKSPIYEELILVTLRFIGTEAMEATSHAEMVSELRRVNHRFMIWGSDDVLAAWIKFRRIATCPSLEGADPKLLFHSFEDLILEIRRDLGHSNSGIRRKDILSMFINDIDQHI